jgi:hypothetical protein
MGKEWVRSGLKWDVIVLKMLRSSWGGRRRGRRNKRRCRCSRRRKQGGIKFTLGKWRRHQRSPCYSKHVKADYGPVGGPMESAFLVFSKAVGRTYLMDSNITIPRQRFKEVTFLRSPISINSSE